MVNLNSIYDLIPEFENTACVAEGAAANPTVMQLVHSLELQQEALTEPCIGLPSKVIDRTYVAGITATYWPLDDEPS